MSTRRWMLTVCMGLALVLPSVARIERDAPALIVIPARYSVVQFCLDVAKLKSVYLTAYDVEARTGVLRLHVWDNSDRAWIRTSLSEFSSGSIFLARPRCVFLVGADGELPAGLAQGSTWGGDVRRIPSLNVVDLVNGLNKELSFSPLEWRWLARRYGLELKDRNADRRRYGKYGPPGRKASLPDMPREGDADVVMPMPASAELERLDAPRSAMPETAGDGQRKEALKAAALEPVIEQPAPAPRTPLSEDVVPEDK